MKYCLEILGNESKITEKVSYIMTIKIFINVLVYKNFKK